MNKVMKIIIVVALFVTVGIIIAIKQQSRNNTSLPASSDIPNPVVATEAESENSEVSIPTETSASLPRLVDLGAGKCIPCKMMAPVLEELKSKYQGKLEVVFIDVWENPDEAKAYGIKMIPTQIFYDASGNELFRHEGFFSMEDILNKWKGFGIVLEAESP